MSIKKLPTISNLLQWAKEDTPIYSPTGESNFKTGRERTLVLVAKLRASRIWIEKITGKKLKK